MYILVQHLSIPLPLAQRGDQEESTFDDVRDALLDGAPFFSFRSAKQSYVLIPLVLSWHASSSFPTTHVWPPAKLLASW